MQAGRPGVPRGTAEFLAWTSDLVAVPLVGYWQKDGRAARQVRFARLYGIEPGQREAWTPDYALAGAR